ncbi:MAG: flagellar export protein FliJ [Terriglobia bacterium]
MPYQFSLRTLLRVRRIYEQRERMRLILLNGARARLRNEFDETGRQRAQGFEELEDKLEKGIAGTEFQFEEASLQLMANRQRELAALIEAIDLQVRKQSEAFRESQIKRKILDSLNERERLAYEQIEDRRDQQRIDDLFTRRQTTSPSGRHSTTSAARSFLVP